MLFPLLFRGRNLMHKVYDLSKDNDDLLIRQLEDIKSKHGIIDSNTNEPIIFNNFRFRKEAKQYPYEVKSKSMIFDLDRINCNEIRNIINFTQENIVLIYRDEEGKLKDTLYIGGQVSKNPYKRILFYLE